MVGEDDDQEVLWQCKKPRKRRKGKKMRWEESQKGTKGAKKGATGAKKGGPTMLSSPIEPVPV